MMTNYYDALGMSPDASADEIKARIHEELRRWTVRSHSPSPEKRAEAERMLRLLREMEQILLDTDSRTEYDFRLKASGVPGKTERVLSPEELEKRLEEAGKLLEKGMSREAAGELEEISASFDDRSDAWALLAEALHRSGETEKALRPMARARDLDSDRAGYIWLHGEMLEALGRNDEVEELYRSATAGPHRGEGLFRLGRLYVNTGRLREGIRLLEESLRSGGEPEKVKRELFLAHLQSATSAWKTVSPGHPVMEPGKYPTSLAEAEMAKEAVAKAEGLRVNDSGLLAKLEHVKEEIRRKTGRTFAGSPLALAVMLAGLGWDVFLNPVPLRWVAFLLPVFYILSALSPKSLVYRAILQGESSRSDFARLWDVLRERYGRLAWGMMLAVYAALFWFAEWLIIPVIILNVTRHYLQSSTGE